MCRLIISRIKINAKDNTNTFWFTIFLSLCKDGLKIYLNIFLMNFLRKNFLVRLRNIPANPW